MSWSTKEDINLWRCDRYLDWKKFYRKEFNSLRDFRNFVSQCLDLYLNSKNNKPNLILNNGERLIMLADKINRLVKSGSSLQIFFLIVCAETINRVLNDQQYERFVSEKSVLNFCNQFFSSKDKNLLETCFYRSLADEKVFKNKLGNKLNFEEIIKYFYRIRCEVAHNGIYWNFHWGDNDTDMMNFIKYKDKKERMIEDVIDVQAGVTYDRIRSIFIRAIINAVKSIL